MSYCCCCFCHFNPRSLTGATKAHAYLRDVLDFPDYYGENLDALHDCLGDISEPTLIKIPKDIAEGKRLGNFGIRLVKVLRLAAEENSALQLRII